MTTEISAGCGRTEKNIFRRRFSVFGERGESEEDLNKKRFEDSDVSCGIMTTTTITHETK